MTIALASIKEGSEESRQKRAVRRYLNKKKGKPVEEATVIEGSEEERQKRAKRIEQKKKGKKEPLEESVIPGSIAHMEHAVHQYHQHSIEHPNYHIHRVITSTNIERPDHYLIVHRNLKHNPKLDMHVNNVHQIKVYRNGNTEHLRQVI